jgi:hypothetical protein
VLLGTVDPPFFTVGGDNRDVNKDFDVVVDDDEDGGDVIVLPPLTVMLLSNETSSGSVSVVADRPNRMIGKPPE